MSVLASEQEKYADIWTFPKYREFSPGEEAVRRFVRVIGGMPEDAIVTDFGCGEGRGSIALAAAGFAVDGWDFVDVRSDAAKAVMGRFIHEPLWRRALTAWHPYGYCIDVLEHVPQEFTMLAIVNMLRYCRTLYLEISTEPDNLGQLIGQPLHLTVQPFVWWRDRLREVTTVRDARDLMDKSSFLVEAP